MINWREKFRAVAIHFLITLAVAACAAALIFLVWYPDPLQTFTGGTKLFLLVVGCDLALGPLISLVIYNSKKPRKELITDYTLVGVVQLAALLYGVYVVAIARPAYVVFVGDRLEIVSPSDIDPADLEQAQPEYRSHPKWGPQFIAVRVPEQERQQALFSALEGKDIALVPKYYVPYDSMLEQIRKRAGSLAELERKHPEAKTALESLAVPADVPRERLRWMPIKSRWSFWTAIIDVHDGQPIGYIPVDPY